MNAVVHSRSEGGASAVEYGLIVFAIAALIAIVVFSFGLVTNEIFTDSCTTIKAGYDSAGMSVRSCA